MKVPAVPTPGAKTMKGEESRFSENIDVKWPHDGNSTVCHVAVGLSADEVKNHGKFTAMEDKPAGCDPGRDQPRTASIRLGERTNNAGWHCEHHKKHYLARLNGGKPDREYSVEVYAER